MLSIQQIDEKTYPLGKKVIFSYQSEKYYKIHSENKGHLQTFTLTEEEFEIPFIKEREEEIFEPYKEGSEVYLAQFNNEEAAIMVIQKMEWNNTLYIHDLYVNEGFKQKGIGQSLIELAKKRATKLGVRAIVLESQTSNYPAIQFYLKNGFQLVGFNLISYSNEDVKNHEVRIELGFLLENLT
ncbi:GNAT family N-acetyltransferase [Solibacillus daqui]|uniref:GNAT family N-acetyltransferase n=1 Tax=Solibacillus daqui TaxID=2912187 RepID=UPI0023665E35|nr:GNAT family N-acetyltransferase [Solibacillus daqui]